jgi:hypothetical protein
MNFTIITIMFTLLQCFTAALAESIVTRLVIKVKCGLTVCLCQGLILDELTQIGRYNYIAQAGLEFEGILARERPCFRPSVTSHLPQDNIPRTSG